MAAGSHFVKKNKSCVLIWNGEKCDQKWFAVIQNGRRQPFCEKKIKVAYWSEMARNAIKIDFRSSKMPFCEKKLKLRIDLKWREMRSKVIFGHPKWPPAAIWWKKIKKKSCVLIWNGEKCIRKWFSVIQNGRRQPFCEKKLKLRIDLKWREMRSKVIFGHPKWQPFCGKNQKN